MMRKPNDESTRIDDTTTSRSSSRLRGTALGAMLAISPLALGVVGVSTLLTACEDQGDFEEAGEEVDDEVDDFTQE